MLGFLVGCSTTPVIIGDTTKPSVIAKTLEHAITNNGDTTKPSVIAKTLEHAITNNESTRYFWVLLYIPVCTLVLVWTWSYFIKGKKNA